MGRPVETLVAQSPQSDPFYANRPGRREAAEWFAALWERFNFHRGIHLRRIHYALVSQREPVELAEGKHYENTFECWQKLCVASRDARHLELVPADWCTDKKSTSIIHLEPTAADITLEEGELGSAMTEMPEPHRLELIPPTVTQPYHLELWCEKTTINDIVSRDHEPLGLAWSPGRRLAAPKVRGAVVRQRGAAAMTSASISHLAPALGPAATASTISKHEPGEQ